MNDREAFEVWLTQKEVNGSGLTNEKYLRVYQMDKGVVEHGWQAALAHARQQSGDYVLVPASALRWLFGEEGEFECPPEGYFRGKPAPYWWRTVFRKMIAAAPAQPEGSAPTLKPSSDQLVAAANAVLYSDVISSAPAQQEPPLPPSFGEWVRKNLPAGTVISDPEWWIPRLYRALKSDLDAAPKTKPEPPQQSAEHISFEDELREIAKGNPEAEAFTERLIAAGTKQQSAEPVACPFCGFVPDFTDDDCIHPVNKERTVWALNCYETGGGCGASILGSSEQDCIDRWKKRAAPPAVQSEPVAYQDRGKIECALIDAQDLCESLIDKTIGITALRDRLRIALRECDAAPPAVQAEPVAWERAWSRNGETPKKERNANGRLAWPGKFKLLPVSKAKLLPDDAPLFAAPPAVQSEPVLFCDTQYLQPEMSLTEQLRSAYRNGKEEGMRKAGLPVDPAKRERVREIAGRIEREVLLTVEDKGDPFVIDLSEAAALLKEAYGL